MHLRLRRERKLSLLLKKKPERLKERLKRRLRELLDWLRMLKRKPLKLKLRKRLNIELRESPFWTKCLIR